MLHQKPTQFRSGNDGFRCTRYIAGLSCVQAAVFETLKRAGVSVTQADSLSDAVLLIQCEIHLLLIKHSILARY